MFSFWLFINSFLAICSTILYVAGVITAIVNPQIGVDDKGNVVDKNRNSRIIFGLLAALFWAIVIAL